MFILAHETDLCMLPDTTPWEINDKITEVVKALDINYGLDRSVDEEDGGFVVYLRNTEDYNEALNQDLGIEIGVSVPEYVELIETLEKDYIYALYLCNNEFSVSLIMSKDIAPQSLIEELN